jgi:radical SAM protein with 4Fe4S-binding SPASM domain
MDTDEAGILMTTEQPAMDQRFALGLGLTNECNLSCSFCYRDPTRTDRMSLEQVQRILAALPVRSVNLGTGENGMHPDFHPILGWLGDQPVRMTMTSNGHSVELLSDDELGLFSDIEFSLDYDNRAQQDGQRGLGNWELIHRQAARCRRAGVPVTIIAVMMKSNYANLASVARIAKRYDAPLRINVYQSVQTDIYALSYNEYWEGFRRLFAETDLISTGEPLVRAMAGLPARRGGCGVGTVRVTPRATVQPCVYWPGEGDPMQTLIDRGAGIIETQPFQDARSLPSACEGCAFVDSCHGGCAGRRRLHHELSKPDFYCPIVRGESKPLAVTMAPHRDMPKSESACTTIVMAREADTSDLGGLIQ